MASLVQPQFEIASVSSYWCQRKESAVYPLIRGLLLIHPRIRIFAAVRAVAQFHRRDSMANILSLFNLN